MKNKWKTPEMIHGVFTKWRWLPFHPECIKISNNVDIGALTCLFGHSGIEIEEDVQIGSHCSLYSLNTENKTKGKIVIKKGAKIGSHTVIFPNVIIEENEEIHSHSVVYMKDGVRVVKGAIRIDPTKRMKEICRANDGDEI